MANNVRLERIWDVQLRIGTKVTHVFVQEETPRYAARKAMAQAREQYPGMPILLLFRPVIDRFVFTEIKEERSDAC